MDVKCEFFTAANLDNTDGNRGNNICIGLHCKTCGGSPAQHELKFKSTPVFRTRCKGDRKLLKTTSTFAEIFTSLRNIRCILWTCFHNSNHTINGDKDSNSFKASLDLEKLCMQWFVYIHRALQSNISNLPLIPASEVAFLLKKIQVLKIRLGSLKRKRLKKNKTSEYAYLQLVVQGLIACDDVYERLEYNFRSNLVLKLVPNYTDLGNGSATSIDDVKNKEVMHLIPPAHIYYLSPYLAMDIEKTNKYTEQYTKENGGTLEAFLTLVGLDMSTISGEMESVTTDIDYFKVQNNPCLKLHVSFYTQTLLIFSKLYKVAKHNIYNNADGHCTNTAHSWIDHIKPYFERDDDSYNKLHASSLPQDGLLGKWQNSIRSIINSAYAFATPSSKSIDKITSACQEYDIQEIIEIGAGTGYWATLIDSHLGQLQRGGKEEEGNKDETLGSRCFIKAYDIDPLPWSKLESESPPTTIITTQLAKKKSNKMNSYHGYAMPCFSDPIQVLEGNSNVLKRSSSSVLGSKSQSKSEPNVALFLCYPPPDNSMSYECIRDFEGQLVFYVGEWAGLTGTKKFEKYLLEKYTLLEDSCVILPTFGPDAAKLYVFIRKPGTNNNEDMGVVDSSIRPRPSHPLLCSSCRVNIATQRCLLARHYVYCSEVCASHVDTVRERDLVLKSTGLFFLGDSSKLAWCNPCHYKKL